MKKAADYIEQVKKDLITAANYPLSDTEEDELRLTGRTCINFENFEPFIYSVRRFLKKHPDTSWSLSLNSVSTDIEITLKNTLISF